MPQLILVDVCNLLHRLPDYRDRLHVGMDQLAEEVLQAIRPLHDAEQWELHLVVDGNRARLEQQFVGPDRTLSIIFSAANQSADTVIESWLMRLGKEWRVCVVSEDRAICHTALAQQAEPLSAEQLFAWVARAQARLNHQQSVRKEKDAPFGNKLEGLS